MRPEKSNPKKRYAPPRLRTVRMFVALQFCTPACPEGTTCIDPDSDTCA